LFARFQIAQVFTRRSECTFVQAQDCYALLSFDVASFHGIEQVIQRFLQRCSGYRDASRILRRRVVTKSLRDVRRRRSRRTPNIVAEAEIAFRHVARRELEDGFLELFRQLPREQILELID